MPLTSWPYITFPGNAREAMTFYHEVFGGELQIRTYGNIPAADFPFTPAPEAVAHAQLESPALRLTGGDDPALSDASLESEIYSMLVGVDTEADGRAVIEKLLAGGGTVLMPFEVAPWGDTYGQIRDRFGVTWAVVAPGEGRDRA